MKVYKTGSLVDADEQQAGSLEALLKASSAAKPSQHEPNYEQRHQEGTTRAVWGDEQDGPTSTNSVGNGPSSGDWGDESHFSPPQSGRFVSGRASALDDRANNQRRVGPWGADRAQRLCRPAVSDVLHVNAQSPERTQPRLLTLPGTSSRIRPMLQWSRDEPDLSEDLPRDTLPASAPPTERVG